MLGIRFLTIVCVGCLVTGIGVATVMRVKAADPVFARVTMQPADPEKTPLHAGQGVSHRPWRHVIFTALALPVAIFAAMFGCSVAEEADFSNVPGVVIAHSAKRTGLYIGSPGIASLGEGIYLAKYDEFGPGSSEWTAAVTHLYRSDDAGRTWRRIRTVHGLFWASLFVHRNAVYLLGVDRHHGNVVMLRSIDGGQNWTAPADEQSGLLFEGQYHTAPTPLVIHQGRIWRAMEDASNGTRWGERYSAFMMSAPVDADLLRRDSWAVSNMIERDASWLDGRFGAWLEGNAVVTPEGRIANVLRVHGGQDDIAAIVQVSPDGTQSVFDPDHGFIALPGGAKKFTIHYDEKTRCHWSLVNHAPPADRHARDKPENIRNTLALVRSADLRRWEIRCIVLHHRNVSGHAFQYVDWLFEGDDIIAVSRTAYEDGLGGAHQAHDANFLTFHRIRRFRDLSMADSVMNLGAGE